MLSFGKVVVVYDSISADRKFVVQVEVVCVFIDVQKLISVGENRFAYHMTVECTYGRISTVSLFI